MKILEFTVQLRKSFEELRDIFKVFNKMISEKHKSEVFLNYYEVSQELKHYITINIYRCKSYASLVVNRDICISSKEIEIFKKLEELQSSSKQPIYNYFQTDHDGKFITISVYNNYDDILKIGTSEPNVFNNNSSAIQSNLKTDSLTNLLSVDLFLRKPFAELPMLIDIFNRMLAKNACSFMKYETNKSKNKNDTRNDFNYFNLVFYFDTFERPSFSIKVSLFKELLPSPTTLSKYNYVCMQVNNPCFTQISFEKSFDEKHGPHLNFVVNVSQNSKELTEIENIFNILETISPQ
mgnify:FL=1